MDHPSQETEPGEDDEAEVKQEVSCQESNGGGLLLNEKLERIKVSAETKEIENMTDKCKQGDGGGGKEDAAPAIPLGPQSVQDIPSQELKQVSVPVGKQSQGTQASFTLLEEGEEAVPNLDELPDLRDLDLQNAVSGENLDVFSEGEMIVPDESFTDLVSAFPVSQSDRTFDEELQLLESILASESNSPENSSEVVEGKTGDVGEVAGADSPSGTKAKASDKRSLATFVPQQKRKKSGSAKVGAPHFLPKPNSGCLVNGDSSATEVALSFPESSQPFIYTEVRRDTGFSFNRNDSVLQCNDATGTLLCGLKNENGSPPRSVSDTEDSLVLLPETFRLPENEYSAESSLSDAQIRSYVPLETLAFNSNLPLVESSLSSHNGTVNPLETALKVQEPGCLDQESVLLASDSSLLDCSVLHFNPDMVDQLASCVKPDALEVCGKSGVQAKTENRSSDFTFQTAELIKTEKITHQEVKKSKVRNFVMMTSVERSAPIQTPVVDCNIPGSSTSAEAKPSFTCPDCKKSFSTNSTLRRHVKNFVCTKKDRQGVTDGSLKVTNQTSVSVIAGEARKSTDMLNLQFSIQVPLNFSLQTDLGHPKLKIKTESGLLSSEPVVNTGEKLRLDTLKGETASVSLPVLENVQFPELKEEKLCPLPKVVQVAKRESSLSSTDLQRKVIAITGSSSLLQGNNVKAENDLASGSGASEASKGFSCSECRRIFSSKYTLRRHQKKQICSKDRKFGINENSLEININQFDLKNVGDLNISGNELIGTGVSTDGDLLQHFTAPAKSLVPSSGGESNEKCLNSFSEIATAAGGTLGVEFDRSSELPTLMRIPDTEGSQESSLSNSHIQSFAFRSDHVMEGSSISSNNLLKPVVVKKELPEVQDLDEDSILIASDPSLLKDPSLLNCPALQFNTDVADPLTELEATGSTSDIKFENTDYMESENVTYAELRNSAVMESFDSSEDAFLPTVINSSPYASSILPEETPVRENCEPSKAKADFTCSECKRIFSSSSTLRRHVKKQVCTKGGAREVRSPETAKMSLAEKFQKSKDALKHNSVKSESSPFSVGPLATIKLEPNEEDIADLVTEPSERDTPSFGDQTEVKIEFKCSVCHKTFTSRYNLHRHLRNKVCDKERLEGSKESPESSDHFDPGRIQNCAVSNCSTNESVGVNEEDSNRNIKKVSVVVKSEPVEVKEEEDAEHCSPVRVESPKPSSDVTCSECGKIFSSKHSVNRHLRKRICLKAKSSAVGKETPPTPVVKKEKRESELERLLFSNCAGDSSAANIKNLMGCSIVGEKDVSFPEGVPANECKPSFDNSVINRPGASRPQVRVKEEEPEAIFDCYDIESKDPNSIEFCDSNIDLKCSECRRSFSTRYSLVRHMKTKICSRKKRKAEPDEAWPVVKRRSTRCRSMKQNEELNESELPQRNSLKAEPPLMENHAGPGNVPCGNKVLHDDSKSNGRDLNVLVNEIATSAMESSTDSVTPVPSVSNLSFGRFSEERVLSVLVERLEVSECSSSGTEKPGNDTPETNAEIKSTNCALSFSGSFSSCKIQKQKSSCETEEKNLPQDILEEKVESNNLPGDKNEVITEDKDENKIEAQRMTTEVKDEKESNNLPGDKNEVITEDKDENKIEAQRMTTEVKDEKESNNLPGDKNEVITEDKDENKIEAQRMTTEVKDEKESNNLPGDKNEVNTEDKDENKIEAQRMTTEVKDEKESNNLPGDKNEVITEDKDENKIEAQRMTTEVKDEKKSVPEIRIECLEKSLPPVDLESKQQSKLDGTHEETNSCNFEVTVLEESKNFLEDKVTCDKVEMEEETKNSLEDKTTCDQVVVEKETENSLQDKITSDSKVEIEDGTKNSLEDGMTCNKIVVEAETKNCLEDEIDIKVESDEETKNSLEDKMTEKVGREDSATASVVKEDESKWLPKDKENKTEENIECKSLFSVETENDGNECVLEVRMGKNVLEGCVDVKDQGNNLLEVKAEGKVESQNFSESVAGCGNAGIKTEVKDETSTPPKESKEEPEENKQKLVEDVPEVKSVKEKENRRSSPESKLDEADLLEIETSSKSDKAELLEIETSVKPQNKDFPESGRRETMEMSSLPEANVAERNSPDLKSEEEILNENTREGKLEEEEEKKECVPEEKEGSKEESVYDFRIEECNEEGAPSMSKRPQLGDEEEEELKWCHLCKKSFGNLSSALGHLLRHKEKYFCEKCCTMCPQVHRIKAHSRLFSLTCEYCEGVFTNKTRLRVHKCKCFHARASVNEDASQLCKSTSETAVGAENPPDGAEPAHQDGGEAVLSDANKEGPNWCSVCRRNFRTRRGVIAHLKSHKDEYFCVECQATVPLVHKVMEHYRIKCGDCGEEFRTESECQKHSTDHVREGKKTLGREERQYGGIRACSVKLFRNSSGDWTLQGGGKPPAQ